MTAARTARGPRDLPRRHRVRGRRGIPLAVACLGLLVACGTVPLTGRSQLRLVSDEQELEMGLDAWKEILRDKQIVTGTPEARMVEDVGQRIARASGQAYAWEFRLIREDQTVNAFCLPGGKIAVFTGMLPVAGGPHGLAAVLGHEVAHAVAHHGAERVSQQLLAAGVLEVASASLASSDPGTRDAILKGLGVSAQVGALLPYSRLHETEADEIGLRYMVRAGYDPEEAVRLWERMARLEGGSTPVFLSTHPDPADRAARLRSLIPRVLAEERR